MTRLRDLEDRNKALRDEIKRLESRQLAESVEDLGSREEAVGPFRLMLHTFPGADARSLREAGDRFKDRLGGDAVIVLAAAHQDKVLWLAMAGADALRKGIHAGDLIAEAARITGGRGGGRPDMAQAGGRDPSMVGQAMERIRQMVTQAAQ